MTTHQTTSHQPVKPWGFGIRDRQMTYPLERCFGLVCGEQGVGKSFIFQKNPRAAIFNMDVSGTVSTLQAEMWPGVADASSPHPGQPIDSSGRSIRITWEEIEKQQQMLVSLAKSNQPRPTLVVFDTLEPLVAHLKDFIARDLKRDAFETIDSKLSWGRLQAALFPFFQELRDVGYGVWVIAHTFQRVVKLSDTLSVERVSLAAAPSIVDYIYRTVEMVIPIKASPDFHEEKKITRHQVAGLGAVDEETLVKTPIIKRVAAFDDPTVFGLRRTRTMRPMKSVRLDGIDDPWAAIEAEYNAANSVD